MAENSVWYFVGFGSIIVVVVLIFLIDQIRQGRKKSRLEGSPHSSPSSFDSDSKLKMITRLDKRESKMRRERILEGGTLPELSELIIYFPSMNEKITSTEVDVRGKTAIRSIVWINDQAAFVDVDGSYIGTIKLFKGKNTIKVVGVGPYGQTMFQRINVNCTSKEAISSSSSDFPYLLPDTHLDIRYDDPLPSQRMSTQSVSISKKKRGKGKQAGEVKPLVSSQSRVEDPILASQTEIDPSVLAVLKGDDLTDSALTVETDIPLDEIEPDGLSIEIPEDEIPPIPDIIEPEIEQQLPSIPKDVVKEDAVDESPVMTTAVEEDLAESVKLLEEVVDAEEEADGTFQPDKMIPKQPGESLPLETQLDEFKPLKQKDTGSQSLIVETKSQKLDDERSTVILQHNGLTRSEDGELVQVLKIEKRIEHLDGKWYSTIGIANTTNDEFKKIEIIEYISNTMVLKDKLPVNVDEPTIDHLPEGAQITWVLNEVKSQMKLFLTYSEDVNPLDIISEEQIQPKIIVRK